MTFIRCLIFTLFLNIALAEEAYLSEKVAAGNDWIINKGQKNSFIKPLTWITSRTVGVPLFSLCTAIDIAVLAGKQIRETPYIILKKDSERHLAEYQKNKRALKKVL